MRTILFLAANPEDKGAHLALEKEASQIDEALRRAMQREKFRLEQRWAVTTTKLQRAMLEVKPYIVHFCGHGAGKAGLAFLDDQGKSKLVTDEALANFFELFKKTLGCVVLNACYSDVQAEAIVQHIDYVVGMRSGITDPAAIKFATGFYDALGAGQDIKNACAHGRIAIQLEGLPEHLTPRLLTKKDTGESIGEKRPDAILDGQPRPSLGDDIYVQKIRDGWFTPFIGPLCCRTAGDMAKAVDHIGGRVTELLRRLGQEQGARDYLKSVVQAKMPGALNARNAGSQACSRPPGLVELQLTLARLGSLATRLFAQAFGNKPSAVTDVREVRVGLSDSGDELKPLLLKACEFSRQACQHIPCPRATSEQSSDLCFGGQARVTEKLIQLALLMLPSKISDRDFDRPEVRAIFHAVRPPGGAQGGPAALSMAQLEWLANLLWHTLRYDAPMYPQPADLAFQLTLCKERAEPVRVRLGIAAAALLEDRAIRCVRSVLKSCEQGVSGVPLDWKGFHAAIATALCQKRPAPRNRFVPLALLTTLDIELERILTACGQAYHVLIPVYKNQDGKTEAAWLLFSSGGPGDREESWHYVKAEYQYGYLAERIKGPLLVKLNGSPLHDLPDSRFVDPLAQEDADRYGPRSEGGHVASPTFRHRLLLSDYQLGEYLRSAERWPECLGPLLGDGKRLLCFLGYDLGDPSDVFGIHDHVRGGIDVKLSLPRGKEQQVFLGPPLDAFRQGILSPLDLFPLGTTLDDVAPTIIERPGLRKLDAISP